MPRYSPSIWSISFHVDISRLEYSIHISISSRLGILFHTNARGAAHYISISSSVLSYQMQESHIGDDSTDVRRIRLGNMSAQVFQILLSFARTFRLPPGLDDDSAWELRNYAHYFDWDLLEAACEELIATRLKPESVCAIWTIAEKCHASTLAEMCQKYFTDTFSLSSMSPSFFVLQKPLLKRALESGNINCDAKVIFNALNTWARFQHHANALSRNAPFDPLHYIGDLLPPCTLFNSRYVFGTGRNLWRHFLD